jgi:two-component system LytT family response regulator
VTLRCLIVDDEELARQRLRELLDEEADVELIGEAADGDTAVESIRKLKPDLVWLDIQMPGCDGFEVLERLGSVVPVVVFVTAYDQYAIRAFDAMALDYVLKPFDRTRFRRALERARSSLAARDASSLSEQMTALLAERGQDYPRRMVVREAGRIHFVQVDDIRWVEAQGNYVKLHTPSGSPMLRCTMTEMESRLDPRRFARTHRSTIVCLRHIRQMSPLAGGDYRILLDDTTELICSRSHVAVLLEKGRR